MAQQYWIKTDGTVYSLADGGGAVSTTGAVVAPVFCNGSAWLYG